MAFAVKKRGVQREASSCVLSIRNAVSASSLSRFYSCAPSSSFLLHRKKSSSSHASHELRRFAREKRPRRQRSSSHGQVAMEYIAIVGFVLLIMIVAVVILQTRGRSTVDQLVGAQLTSIGQKLVDAAETVYYLGPPSTVTVRASIPQEISDIIIEQREIVFTFRVGKGTSDISVPSPVNLTGSIPATAGVRDITLVSRGTSVEISG